MIILHGLNILLENKWLDQHAVIIEHSSIKDIVPMDRMPVFPSARFYQFPQDYFLFPGFIDLHVHGVNGHDVMDNSEIALTGISQALAKEGVTGFLATTMSAKRERLDNVLITIAEFMCGESRGAAILGVHLEGPFISQSKRGAQLESEIAQPNIDLIKHWQHLANDAIKLVTLAPELPHAHALMTMLKEMGIVISVGHTNATYAETQHAIQQGCSHATHLFNAMRGMQQREPGAVTALLLDHNVSTELIVDGIHLHPAIVDLTLRLKPNDKFILVTDAIRAKCLGDGQYELGGQMVTVKNNKAVLENGALAGSVLSMPQAIKNVMKFTQCSLMQAVNMASYNPAQVLNLGHSKGSIAKGKDADLVVMNADLEVVMTISQGKVVLTPCNANVS